jgi:hypothetical protein
MITLPDKDLAVGMNENYCYLILFPFRNMIILTFVYGDSNSQSF